MADQLQDNTAVRGLRRDLDDLVAGYEERLLREIARMKEEAEDLDSEIKEGMSNRIGDGFLPSEALKYAQRIKENIYGEAMDNIASITSALRGDIQAMIGPGMDPSKVEGRIGMSKPMILEQSELDIVKLQAPAEAITT